MSERLVAGGYLLVHHADTPQLDGILTVSDCLTCACPSWWAVSWVEADVAERRGFLAHWGVDPRRLPDVVDDVTSALEDGTLGWPSVFASPNAARRFVRRHRVTHPTLVLVGLGIEARHVPEFLRGLDTSESGHAAAVSAGKELAPGRDAGWEALGYDGGGFHSWHCHDLVARVRDELGIRPDRRGLLRTREDAGAVADLCNDPASGCERVPWLPWLLRTYETGP